MHVLYIHADVSRLCLAIILVVFSPCRGIERNKQVRLTIILMSIENMEYRKTGFNYDYLVYFYVRS